MTEIIYKDISYKIVGALFKVFNTLGHGYRESYYQRALEHEFKKLNLPFKTRGGIRYRRIIYKI